METRKGRTPPSLTAQQLYRTISSEVNEPEYHTYECRERRGITKNETPLEHSLYAVSNARYPELLNYSRWNKTLETFANKASVSQNSKGIRGSTQQRIYRKPSSRDHQLTKKSTYTLIQNIKYPFLQAKEGTLKDVQVIQPPIKSTIGQLAAKSLKRVLESPFKKPTLFSVHATQLIDRNRNNVNSDAPAYLTLKPENESNSQRLIHQRTFTKLPLKPVTKNSAGPLSSMSMKRNKSFSSTNESSESETKTQILHERSYSVDKMQESKDSKCISQFHYCQHGIYIGPSNEPSPNPSTHSMSVQTLEERHESKLKIPTTITVETSTLVYSTDKASLFQKEKVCHLDSEEVKGKISNNYQSQPNSKVVVNIPYSKSGLPTQNTTTQYRMKDDGGKHYIIPTKYKAKHYSEMNNVKVTKKKYKKIKKNAQKKSVSHSCVTAKSSLHSAKKSISSHFAMKKISKCSSKQKNCSDKSTTSIKSNKIKQSKSNDKKTVKTERAHFTQSGNCIKSTSGKQRAALRILNPIFNSATPKTLEDNKSDTKASCLPNSSPNTIQTQTSDTALNHNGNLPICCVIWKNDGDIKKKVMLPTACRSKVASVKTVVGTAKKRKSFTANCIKRRRSFIKPTRSLFPNFSSVKFPNHRMAPRLPPAAMQALSSIPTKVVVRGQDPPYALRRLLAGSGASSLKSSPLRYLQSGFPGSEEMQAWQKTLVDTSSDRREKREDASSGMCSMAIPLPISKRMPLLTFTPGSVSGTPLDSFSGWSSMAGSLNLQDVSNGSIAWASWPPMKSKSQQINYSDACTNTVATITTSESFNIDTATSAETLAAVNKATSVESNIMLVTRSTSMSLSHSVDAAAGTSAQFVSNRTAMMVKAPTPALNQVPLLTASRSVPGPKHPPSPAKYFPPVSTKIPSEAKLVNPESYPLCRLDASSKCLNMLTRVCGRTDLRNAVNEEENYIYKRK